MENGQNGEKIWVKKNGENLLGENYLGESPNWRTAKTVKKLFGENSKWRTAK